MSTVTALKQRLATAPPPSDYYGHSAKVHSVGWNCDGGLLASGSLDKSVCLWQLAPDGRLSRQHVLRGHADSVDQLCWHGSRRDLLATASGDKTVRLWDTRGARQAALIGTKGENINIAWSPDGNTLAVGNKEDLVSFIDVRQRKIIRDEQFRFEVNEIVWSSGSDMFFMTSGHGHVFIISYPELQVIHDIVAHPANCICIEFSPDASRFAVGSADALLSVWDARELYCSHTMSRLEWPVRTVSFSHDSRLVAAASEDLVIDVSCASSGARVAAVAVRAATYSVAWHPKSHLLAYACDDKDERDRDAGSVKLWGLV